MRPLMKAGESLGFSGADLVLFVLHVDLEKHHPRLHIVGCQLMQRLLLLARRPDRFAINGYVVMRTRAASCLQAASFLSAALLGLPARKEGAKQLIKRPGINAF